ncbi:hypothetical protein ACHAXR_006634 [Thalassiosira sp. AJA248-18]
MTISALLTSELLLNRCGETGRFRNVGLLELYTSYLGDVGGKAAGIGFLIVSYLVMGVYLSEGGDQLLRLLEMGKTIFATVMGTFLSTAAKFNTVQRAMTNFFVPLTLVAFLSAVIIGLPTTDFGSLFALENQHPEVVLNAFPLLFMSWTYHGVVPRVVYDLEGDKNEITKAIVVGSTSALIMYLTWNAMILGNVLGSSGVDGVMAESAVSAASSLTLEFKPLLQSSVAVVSELAVTTSLIGVVLGFVNEFEDLIGTPSKSYGPKEDNKWKVALLTLLPPAIVSICLGYYAGSIDINNYEIIDYTGIFGSSILFLILPALMAWQNRYGEEDPRPLTVRPMVPLGKISLGSLYKAAGTLIVEQGLEKLGVFEFVKEQFSNFSG